MLKKLRTRASCFRLVLQSKRGEYDIHTYDTTSAYARLVVLISKEDFFHLLRHKYL